MGLAQEASLKQLLQEPRQWPWLLLCACLFVLAQAPLAWLLRFGRMLAPVTRLLARKRYRVIKINIAIAFPELDQATQQELSRAAFRNSVLGLLETAAATWRRRDLGMHRIQVEGLSLLDNELAQGHGVLLLAAHFTPMMLCARALSEALGQPVPMLSRKHNQRTLSALSRNAYQRWCRKVIDKRDLIGLIRTLRAGDAVYYAPDQHLLENVTIVPFFSRPVATLAITPRIVRSAKVPVLLISIWRDADLYHLKLETCPAVISHGTPEASAAAYMHWLETVIRRYPAQYLWAHRRFKPNAEARPDPYAA